MKHLVPAVLIALVLPFSPLLAAAPAELVSDINTFEEPFGSLGGTIQGALQPLGGRLLFTAWEPSSTSEPWVSDGTSAGTGILRDLCPGSCASSPLFLGRTGGAAVFQVEVDQRGGGSGAIGYWRTDGTRAGTAALELPGVTRCFEPTRSAEVGGVVVFTARRDGESCGLWRTDGTAAGTRRLTDERPSYQLEPLAEEPRLADGKLFFFLGSELWRTDGSEAGTLRLGDFRPGGDYYFDYPRLLTPVGSKVVFVAEAESGGGEELWVSDGTAAGTRAVTQFAPENPFRPDHTLKVFGETVYFVADDVTNGSDLWQTDGTAAGTRRVTNFGYANPLESSVLELQLGKAGSRLVFVATDGINPTQIWTSGGTPATTAPLTGCPGGCPSVDFNTRIETLNNRVLLNGSDPAHGQELWSTDGTGAGTRRVRDLCPGACGSELSSFEAALGRLFFVSGPDFADQSLWATDGTTQGTLRLADLGSRAFNPPFSPPFTPVTMGGRIYFAAGDEYTGGGGRQLWTSDGTPEGSGLVTLIGRSGPSSSPRELTAFGDGLLFFAFDGLEHGLWRSGGTVASTAPLHPAAGDSYVEMQSLTVAGGVAFFLRGGHLDRRVWRSDGTDAGTFPVSAALSNLANLTTFKGRALFTTFEFEDTLLATEFWESDGTVAGTRKLFELPRPAYNVRGLRAFGQTLYFLADPGEIGSVEQVWASDGTSAGTRRLTSLDTSFDRYVAPDMIEVGGRVYFEDGRRLWRTDGTPAGTVQVVPDGLEASFPSDLVAFQGRVYFMGSTQQGTIGRGLWSSDGTAAGTVLVKPVAPHDDGSHREPAWPTVLGSSLFFAAEDGVHGLELWRTDGTGNGTVLVRDMAPGSASSFPRELTADGGRLLFSANDGVHGFEPWESDGGAGTRMVQDIAPGATSSQPLELTLAGGRVFFNASDGVSGSELWNLPLAGTSGCQASDKELCLGGRFRVAATWRDFQGNSGQGHAVALTADTGYFWFFDAANVEVVLKVLDGLGVNGHHWVFYGALSTVEYTLTVTDTQTGASRRYINPPGRLGSVGDTTAFGPKGATGSQQTLGPAGEEQAPRTAAARAVAASPCIPSATRLCLQGGRFAVDADWRDFQGNTGKGKAVPLAGGDTGYFWFFGPENVEVVLKVLDGRPLNGKFWVFYGALSSVEYTLTVTDTETGKVKRYENPSGRLGSVADTGAF